MKRAKISKRHKHVVFQHSTSRGATFHVDLFTEHVSITCSSLHVCTQYKKREKKMSACARTQARTTASWAQRAHTLVGFMNEPTGHLKASANSGMLRRGPLTRNLAGLLPRGGATASSAQCDAA